MDDSLSKRWSDPNVLENVFDSYRRFFRPANSKVVRDIFKHHISENSKILEIGSGLGELVDLVPEYKSQIQQTDQSQSIVARHKSLHPDSNIICANVYELPFRENSFDVVVGYSSFDTLSNLEKALSEVYKVLSPNGKFIHFLDCRADPAPIFERYKHCLVFPFKEKVSKELVDITGVRIVSRKDYKRKFSDIDKKSKKILKIYLKDPEGIFFQCINSHKDKHLLSMIADAATKLGEGKIVRFTDDFKERLQNALSKTNYKILFNGIKEGKVNMKRNGIYQYFPSINLFYNDAGLDRSQYIDLKQDDEIEIISRLYVVIASKT